jgi:hypothetical protein
MTSRSRAVKERYRPAIPDSPLAPAFMALTDIGMSPWPVMKMIGIGVPARKRSHNSTVTVVERAWLA